MSARSYLKGVALGLHIVLRRSPPEPPPVPRECLSVYYPCRELAPATPGEKPAYDLHLLPRQPAVPHLSDRRRRHHPRILGSVSTAFPALFLA